jgi:transcriptional regulator with XRE-family HTH domain
MSTLGERVREARKRLKLSQAELAKRVGVRQPTINDIENESTKGTAHIVKLAIALRVSPFWLDGGGPLKTMDELEAAILSLSPELHKTALRIVAALKDEEPTTGPEAAFRKLSPQDQERVLEVIQLLKNERPAK